MAPAPAQEGFDCVALVQHAEPCALLACTPRKSVKLPMFFQLASNLLPFARLFRTLHPQVKFLMPSIPFLKAKYNAYKVTICM